jgi:hypothetical protein
VDIEGTTQLQLAVVPLIDGRKPSAPSPGAMNARMRGSSSINRIRIIDRRRGVLDGNVDFRFRNVALRLRTARFPLRVAEADRRKAVVRGTISALS